MKLYAQLLFSLIFLSSSFAMASGEGIYLGINAINGKIDVQDTTVNGVTYIPSSNSSFGGGLSYGYNVSEHVAIDGAFDGLNVVDFNGDNSPTQQYWFSYLAIKPMLDFWQFNAFVSLGAAYVNLSQNNPGNITDTTNSMVRPYGGAGLGFNFNQNTELDLSYNRIQDTNTPITFAMLTLTYHFVQRYEDSGFLAD
jgi:hypothetical protein